MKDKSYLLPEPTRGSIPVYQLSKIKEMKGTVVTLY